MKRYFRIVYWSMVGSLALAGCETTKAFHHVGAEPGVPAASESPGDYSGIAQGLLSLGLTAAQCALNK